MTRKKNGLGVGGDQRGRLLVNELTWIKFKKHKNLNFVLPYFNNCLFKKYFYMLDILIHQFVHREFFDNTLPIQLNF